ncbi:sensor histidine kinase [Bacillus sp. PS06]|uniref:cache domain-containing sensor histidine kinase n=1 Tax=Bacillus sp. PS06 TaxID=2764176 RepID=UPI00177FC852|nr:sensor histidine kinase [Bacillus sp. PS06]MBD8068671.1 sensor histidine kinase [Bacillus sp. PS06]
MISRKWKSSKLTNLPLKTKLMITYVLLTLIPMAVLGLAIYYQNIKSIEEEVGEYIPRLLKQANQNIENEINDLENLPNLIYNSRDVIAVLRSSPYKEQSALLEDKFTVESFLSSTYLGRSKSEILGAFLLSNNRAFVSTTLEYEGFHLEDNYLPYGEPYDLDDEVKIVLPHQVDLRFEDDTPYILLIKELKDLDNRDNLGTLILAVKVDFIKDVLQDVDEEENATMWVMDEQGQIVYHTDESRIGTTFHEMNEYPLLNGSFRTKKEIERTLISVNQTQKNKWIIVHSIPLKYLTEGTDVVRNVSVIIFMILVLITTIISIFLAMSVTRPINLLAKRMKDVEKGNFDVDIPIDAKDEVGVLANSFRSMLHKIKELIHKNYQIRISQKEAELYALQSQINPHFIYNTLESVGSAVEEGEQDLVVDMVAILGKMLRYSLSNKDNLVPMKDEVEHIQHYLTLQKFRFEDRIMFDITNNLEKEDYYTPKFILQPIVENSIKYGLEHRKSLKLTIIIKKTIGQEGTEYIDLCISDNGPGIEETTLASLMQKLNSEQMLKSDSGFGVTNVHSRIKMMFGIEFGLEIDSKKEDGTEITIRIPVIHHKDIENDQLGAGEVQHGEY